MLLLILLVQAVSGACDKIWFICEGDSYGNQANRNDGFVGALPAVCVFCRLSEFGKRLSGKARTFYGCGCR